MNDCTSAEMRDQLPDLLHERLDASARAAVLAHVDGCVDCRDELELLRSVQRMLVRQTPRMDVAYIVGALPKTPQPRAASIAPAHRRRVWTDWRVAAAITVLVAGGGSYAVVRSSLAKPSAVVSYETQPTVAPSLPTGESTQKAVMRPESSLASANVPAANATPAEDAAADSRFGDLNEQQLQALLNDVKNLRAVPVTEPEPVSLKVNAKISSSEIL